MRELKTEELASVSGAGIIADAAALLGQGIGKIIDASHNSGTKAAEAGETLGRGVGTIVEASVTLFQNLWSGISSLINKN